MKWEKDNEVKFDNAKYKAIAFTRRRKLELKGRIAEARITMHGDTMGFNTDRSEWLGVYLYTGLKFRAHRNLTR